MFKLEDMRRVVEHGEYLSQKDCNYANKLLAEGLRPSKVWACIESWADQYKYAEECETREARKFEQDAYGRD